MTNGQTVNRRRLQNAVAEPKPRQRIVQEPDGSNPKLNMLGGSRYDAFNDAMIQGIVNAQWMAGATDGRKHEVMQGALAGAIGIRPRDEIEGMLVTQMLAAHAASLECYRRAMLPEQTTEARAMNLSHAGKLSRAYAQLVDTLNRHRGKGTQKIIVERVTVESGGQAVVGVVEGGGVAEKIKGQPHAPKF
jgi:hypothetical protein